jgi:hypothetical protein
MPRDSVNRHYFQAVCEERDTARDTLRETQRQLARLQLEVREHHRAHDGEGSAADRRLWQTVYGPEAPLPTGWELVKVHPATEWTPGRTVGVGEMGGRFEGGPDSVEWLRRQRERDTDG